MGSKAKVRDFLLGFLAEVRVPIKDTIKGFLWRLQGEVQGVS